MVTSIFRSEAPQHRTAITIKVNWFVAFGIVTTTAGAHRFAAAIVIRHKVIPTIDRVRASANPGYW